MRRILISQARATCVARQLIGGDEHERGKRQGDQDGEDQEDERARPHPPYPLFSKGGRGGAKGRKYRIPAEPQADEQCGLDVSGQRGHTPQRARSERAAKPLISPAPFSHCAREGGAGVEGLAKRRRDPGQPRRNSDEIIVAKVNDEHVGKHPCQRRCKRRHAPRVHSPHQNIHTQACPPDVPDRHQLHHKVGQVRHKQKDEQVDGIKQARLVIGGERHPTIKVRIPQGENARLETARGKRVRGPEKRDQIAAARRHPGAAKEDAPVESSAGQREEENGENIESARRVSCQITEPASGNTRWIRFSERNGGVEAASKDSEQALT